MHLTTVIGLDLSAAFDTVSHSILVQRIRDEFGVYGMSLACLQSYIIDHRHYVKLSHHCSSTVQCKASIPQGSVLSLIHFASYISPVGQQRHGKLWAAGACATPTVTEGRQCSRNFGMDHHQYADGMQLFLAMCTSSTQAGLMTVDACTRDIKLWFAENNLLNADK